MSKAAAIELESIVSLLKSGYPVVIPTDTVYGLALMVDAAAEPEVLFRIKNRPPEKSIPWLIGSFYDLAYYTQALPKWAVDLAKKHWPGALTLVCRASGQTPLQFQADDGSLAVRMPNHELVLQLLSRLEAPLATTSANISGQPPVASVGDLDPLITRQVSGVLTDSSVLTNREAIPSTIVSCLGDFPVILRQGAIDLSAELADISSGAYSDAKQQ